ncbi:hypothetical protein AAG570_009169 [Ranatra chinensis]|uniref:Uncharacterized protein n=1 Tax=Ranatra chinensis TaxID=642074 RepID=A0ABD0ZGB3_9HEMI
MKVLAMLLVAGLMEAGLASPREARGLRDWFGSPTTTPPPPPTEKPGFIGGLVNFGTNAVDKLLHGGQTPPPPTEASMLGKLTGAVGGAVGGLIKPPGLSSSMSTAIGAAGVASNVAGMVATGTGLASDLTSKVTAISTDIGKAALQGSNDLVHMGLNAGSEMTNQALGIVDSVGLIVKPARPVTNLVTGMTKPITDQAFGAGHSAIDAATGLATSIIDTTNKTVQGTTAVVSGIAGTLGAANKGVGKVTGFVGKWLV